MMRKTKIICTLGPASSSDAMLSALLRGGMDAARFNFSHGSHASHLAMLEKLRAACRQEGISVATILDTKGPEIRIGTFADCLLYTSPSPRDRQKSRMPSSA